MKELLQAAFLIFVAELGDKTQIMAMSFATRYKVRQILLGVGIGVILNHGLAVIVGTYLNKIVHIDFIQLIAGILFILFGYMSLKIEEDEESEKEIKKHGPIITVALAFFLGEMGDKTQLTAMALASDSQNPIMILLGTTIGMIFTSAIGIVIGMYLGKKVPEKILKVFSGGIFVILGAFKLFQILQTHGINDLKLNILILSIFIIYGILILKFVKSEEVKQSKYKIKAENLNIFRKELKIALYDSCSNKMQCNNCKTNGCLLCQVYELLNEVLNENTDKNYELNIQIGTNYEREKIIQALNMIIEFNDSNSWKKEQIDIKTVRYALEEILINERIEIVNDSNFYKKQFENKNKSVYDEINNVLKNQ